ncbi:MAG: peptide chain release factor N(5)-glutamine methyltransferase [Chloroflexi bacterium]|nr:peptide chain release factor N(5)-glutamine methyltransferase [Chloroflexota bacterium]
MTLAEALHEAATRLLKAGIDDPRLEAEVLLRHALGVDREELFARLQEPLALELQALYEALVDRRLEHEPTAYIIGHKEFFGLDFACSPAALIPRPETELLVETAIEWVRGRGSRVKDLRAVDVGSGSGVIAVSLATHLPQARVIATDISDKALALGRRNALAHCVASQIEFVRGSLLEHLSGRFDLIAANLPYIPSQTYNSLPPGIREHEPEAALRAGRRGTALIEAMLAQAVDHLAPGGVLLAEHAWNQGRRLREAATGHFPTADIETRRDLAGLERLLVVRTARD